METDKATVVYEAEADGTIGSILVPEGETASIGEPIATLANGDGAAPAAADSERANATPVARRTAVELGVSLHGIVGTGAAGRITREDVERAAAESGAAAPEPTVAPEPASGGKGDVQVLELTPTQATIARRMVESATTIPSFTVSADIDMSLITALAAGGRGENQDVPSINDFVVKAAAAALKEFPRFNASYVDGKVECYSRVNIGVAVATEDALLVPVVQDAGEKTLAQIAQETKRLAEAARSRSLAPEDLHDGTFTVSNLGMFGVRSFDGDHRPAAGRDPRRRRRPARACRGRPRRRCLPRSDDRHPHLRPPRRLRRRRREVPVPATRAARAAARPHPLMAPIPFRTAIRDALDEELAADERVILFGEDIAAAGGVFATTTGLYDKYGPERVFDTPISELAMTGAAFGSAVTGLRPVLEIMFGDFLTLAMDSLVNQSSKYWFLTQEQVSVPLTIRSVVGGRRSLRRDPLADAGLVVHGRARGSRSWPRRRRPTRRRC